MTNVKPNLIFLIWLFALCISIGFMACRDSKEINKEEILWHEDSSPEKIAQMITADLLSRPEFKKACRKAWLALVEHINEGGKVIDVCAGTSQGSDINYYLTRPRITGDLHGQAPVL